MKKGMTRESVEQMATEIEQAGEDIRQVFQKVSDRVSGLDWTGADRDRYVSEFADSVGTMVDQVVQNCTSFAERGRADSAEQSAVSS